MIVTELFDVAAVELVEIGIRVLLHHVERRDVVLPAVVVVVSKNPDTEIGVVENEAAEIAHERLDAEPRRHEVVIA